MDLWPLVEKALADDRLLLIVDGLDEWAAENAARTAAHLLQVYVQAARMNDNKNIAVVSADLRDVHDVLARAGDLLDFSQPVALLFIAVLHCIADADDPAGIAGRYMDALAPGSYVAISHSTDEFAPERTRAASQAAAERGATWLPRSKEEIARMFNGRTPVDPGLVLTSYWRPDSEPGPDAHQAWAYCGVAPV